MIDSSLYHRLAPVTRRFQLRRMFLSLAVVWTIGTVVGLALWWCKMEGIWHSDAALPALCACAFLMSIGAVWFALRDGGDTEHLQTVRDIEKRFPELDSSLITAVEQQPAMAHGSLGYLQQAVVRKAVYHGYQNSWNRVVPQWQMLMLPMIACAGLLALMTTVFGLMFTPGPSSASAAGDASVESIIMPGPGGFRIEPGDTEIERFTSLMVLARFPENSLPTSADLIYWATEQNQVVVPMNKSLDDPLFGARIDSVGEPIQYQVRFDGEMSETFDVSVFEFPRLKRADAQLVFPEYTEQEPKLVQDVRRVSAVQGTRLTWLLTLNKPIQSGRMLAADGQQFDLTEDPVTENRYLVDMTLQQSMKLELKLTDEEGRENKAPPGFSVQVVGNQPPSIEQVAPAADVEVSPVEELTLVANFRDDFGVERAGVTYSMVGQEEQEIVLENGIPGREKRQSSSLLAFEDLQAEPNQLLTFYFWAEDKDSRGQVRRTPGDIHMVTVRSFESIFRQGQQPAGGQPGGGGGQQGGQQGGQPGMELPEMQREIIYAIWNLVRREIFDTVTDSFVDDVTVVAESQATAMAQLEEQAAMLQNPDLRPVVDQIRQYQQETTGHLQAAANTEQVAPLNEALLSAQKAYQALLQLRNLEADVAQSQQQQQQGGGGGGGNRQRQQMQQLELENDENRYESEQTASERQESTEERENRQVLSRLRELARRQNDLNKRIKELQTALEEAESAEDRKDIEEQLKRLREEQQQILRDTEELQERMERPENEESMSEQARQLEEARENARQASDALEQGDTTRAAAEGTRALRDMEELRDEFQNRSSGQFDDQMQQMRNEARDIEKEQQEIADAMNDPQATGQEQRRSLSDDQPDSDLAERLDQQRERVEELRESMRETIEQAEEFEPILAERLYDAYRKSQQESAEEALDSTAQSLRQGFEADARQEQQRAARNIEQLREGIDRAAESVLGDETEALRRANRELQRLSSALEEEFDRANPDARNVGQNPGEDSASGEPGESNAEGAAADQEAESENERGTGESENESTSEEEGTSPPRDPGEGEGKQGPEGQRGGTGDANESQESPAGRGGDQDANPDGSTGQNPRQPRSLREPSRQDPAGGLGANPEINYDQETWQDPITGDDFMQWSDRMRDVEEMVADPELRAEAARIREDARSIRRDIKRHANEPNWDLIRLKVIEPMVELQDRVHEELIRRSGDKSLVPVDRDPVPAEFEGAVKRYFEQLGRGQ